MVKKLISILVFCTLSSLTLAEGSGLNLNLGQFDIRVEFNDNVSEDEITGMEYVREPSGLLFDLISLIQSNQERVSNVNQQIYVDADNLNKSFSVYLYKPPEGYAVKKYNISHLDKNLLFQSVCKALKINDCKIPEKDAQTYFYISSLLLSKKRTDLIEFGCFPCNNDLIYSLTKRYTSSEPNVQKPRFTKLTVNRQTIYHYFNKIIP